MRRLVAEEALDHLAPDDPEAIGTAGRELAVAQYMNQPQACGVQLRLLALVPDV